MADSPAFPVDPEASPKSWADMADEPEFDAVSLDEEKHSASDGEAHDGCIAPLPSPTLVGAVRGIADIISRAPDSRETYAALRDCGMIDRSNPPPATYRTGTPLQIAIYEAFFLNPRGVNTRADSPICWRRLIDCMHARVVATIHAIVVGRGGTMNEESIAAISIMEFRAIFGTELSIVTPMWSGMWPLYLNAKLHVETYNHSCLPRCIIADAPRSNPLRDSEEQSRIQKHIAQHRATYYHGAMPRELRGPPRAPSMQRKAPGMPRARAPEHLEITRKYPPIILKRGDQANVNQFSVLGDCSIASVIEQTRQVGKKRATPKKVAEVAEVAEAPK